MEYFGSDIYINCSIKYIKELLLLRMNMGRRFVPLSYNREY
jgi:hypothetical protein